jgi:hypothetical protein
MTIVPIGKLVLQEVEGQGREAYLHELVGELQAAVKTVVTRCIEAELEREETQALKRKAHGRSKKSRWEAQRPSQVSKMREPAGAPVLAEWTLPAGIGYKLGTLDDCNAASTLPVWRECGTELANDPTGTTDLG